MRGTILFMIALLVAAGGVQASLLEETTGIYYQNDGDQGHDAPDGCGDPEAPDPASTDEVFGQLVVVDDAEDHWALAVGEVPGDGTLELDVHMHTLEDTVASLAGVHLLVVVRAPGCGAVLATAFVESGGQATLVVPVEEPGVHDIGLLLQDPVSTDNGTAGLPGPIPTGYHCQPVCAFDYRMTVVA